MLRMFKELEYKRNSRERMMEAESIRDAYSILLEIATPGTERYVPNDKREQLRPVIEFIHQNYNKNITNNNRLEANFRRN